MGGRLEGGGARGNGGGGGAGSCGGGEGAKQIIIAHTTPLAVIRLSRGFGPGDSTGVGGGECRRGGGGWWGGGSGVCPSS